MKKLTTTTAAFLLLIAAAQAQVFNAVVNTRAALNRPCLDGFGNLYTGGFFADSTEIGGTTLYGTGNNNDPILVKWDAAGSPLWYRHGGSMNDDKVVSTRTDGMGNVYAIISFDMTTAWEGATYTTFGGSDFLLVKHDAYGNLLWAKQIGSTDDENGYYAYLNLDGAGKVHLMTISNSATFKVGASSYTLNGSGYRYVHTKLEPATGNPITVSAIGSTNSSWPIGAGGFYVDANENIYGAIGSGVAIDLGGTSLGAGAHFFKMNASGGVAWVKSGGFGGDRGCGIAVDGAGNVTVTGDWDTNLNLGDTTATQTGVASNDVFIIHYDAAGNYQWSKIWGGVGSDEAPTCIAKPDGSLFILGATGGMNAGGYTLTAGGSSDPYWMTLSESGQVLEAQCAHSPGMEVVYENQTGNIDNTGNIVIACGTSVGNNYGPFSINNGAFVNLLIAANPCEATGKVYNDMDNNGAWSAGDYGLPYAIVSDLTGQYYAMSGTSGSYELQVPAGVYTLNVPNPPLYHTLTTPATQTATFTALGQTDTGNHFGFYPTPGVRDLMVSATSVMPPKPGQLWSAILSCKNVGTDTASGTLRLGWPSSMSYFFSSPSPSLSLTDSAHWAFSGLLPGETAHVQLYFSIPSSASAGTVLPLAMMAESPVADMTPGNNAGPYNVTVVSSYDPNYKDVTPANVAPAYVQNHGWFDYAIHFQNTGTDTAFNIVIRDTLDANLDISTLEMLDASHPYAVSLKNPRVLELHFNNILLPDSNVNESASHGVVHFRIKADAGMPTPGIIPNTAAIYFDYNAPVITDTAFIIIGTLDVAGAGGGQSDFLLYPNPATDQLFVAMPAGTRQGTTLTISDATGRMVMSQAAHEGVQAWSIRHLTPGVYYIQAGNGGAARKLVIVR